MGRRIVPEDHQRRRVVRAQLLRKGHRGLGAAVAHQGHGLDLARLPTDRGVVTGLPAIAGARGVHQGRRAFEHPLPAQADVGKKVRLVHEEVLGAGASARRLAYSATNVSRLAASALSRHFLGRLTTKPRRCR
jgi:hypothetical protein